MVKNPIMFVVEVGMMLSLILTMAPNLFSYENVSRTYLFSIFFILLLTLIFANFSEALAEGRGKAQAKALRQTQTEMTARRIKSDGSYEIIDASQLKKGDIVRVETGEQIPNDGQVINGLATVDESAITGESAPVIKESGGDFNNVIGGTSVTSDWLEVEITSNPGQSFLDKMIYLVENATRKKTPNEIALFTLLMTLTIVFSCHFNNVSFSDIFTFQFIYCNADCFNCLSDSNNDWWLIICHWNRGYGSRYTI